MDGAVVQCHPDGSIVYRASSLGSCDMMLLAARLEYEPIELRADSPMRKVFERGHTAEVQMRTLLRQKTGWYIPAKTEPEKRVELVVSDRIKVVGHYDDTRGYDIALVEYKSQSQEEWDRFNREGWNSELFLRYKWQISAYMIAVGMPCYLVRGLWNGEKITEIDLKRIEEPFYSLADIRGRVLRVEAVAQTGVLAAECKVQFPCPYFYLHDDIDREFVDDDVVEKMAREYEDAKREMVVAKGKQESSRRALRETIEGNKITTKTGVKVTFYEAANPPSIDKLNLDAFLKKHDSSLDEFQRVGKSERIRVTLPKDDDYREDGDGESGGLGD